jgi:D-alanine-D-alanine ligase
MRDRLENVVIVYEMEAAAARRLERFGYSPEIAAEIAVYLAQATDLPDYFDEIRDALGRKGASVNFIELDDFPAIVPELSERADHTLIWCQTDGLRFYRGSGAPFVARLIGAARYGSSPLAQALCQNKFQCLALAQTAGLTPSPTLLLEGREILARLGGPETAEADYFVKPNTLGAKIGIFANSRCATMEEAREAAARLWDRYRERAVVQPFVKGDDVRVSFMDTGGAFADQLGLAQLKKNPDSETGGAFMTMKDNETLSGAKDLRGTRGGFGASRVAAFTPEMIDLRGAQDARTRDLTTTLAAQAERLARLVGLSDYFSMDFRVDEKGEPTFFEFEVCPAVTIYDFQTYLGAVHRLPLGEALARSMLGAYERRLTMTEA